MLSLSLRISSSPEALKNMYAFYRHFLHRNDYLNYFTLLTTQSKKKKMKISLFMSQMR